MATTYIPRTQKAKGLVAIRKSFRTPFFTVVPIEKAAYHRGKMVGKFVRPCPMVPRHGFVDSRLVNNLTEASALIKETKAQDSQAEFIISELITAQHNAIWTPDVLVMGPGHDGATGGKDSVTIPTIGDLTNEQLRNVAGVTDSPFVEAVYDEKHNTYFTQLRNGPKVPSATDYIPETVTVANVVTAEGDLLEWESKVKTFTPGTVVYHPGGSLASHYSIHAVLNHTPVVISHCPEVGEVLEQVSEAPRNIDFEEMRKGFYLGCVVRGVDEKLAARTMLVACHHMVPWHGYHDRLIGLGMGFAWRLTCTAALGENRHCPSVVKKSKGSKPERQEVYAKVYNNVLGENRWRFFNALYNFSHEKWPSSFGGKKWYLFGKIGMEMLNNFVREDWPRAMESFNILIHAVHNGGWAFNKFLSADEMDTCAVNPVQLAIQVAPVLYKASRIEVTIPTNSYKGLPKVASVPRWFKQYEANRSEAEKAVEELAKKAALKAKEEAAEKKKAQNALAEALEKLPSHPLGPQPLLKAKVVQAKFLNTETKEGVGYTNYHLQWKTVPSSSVYQTGNVSIPTAHLDPNAPKKPTGTSFHPGSLTHYHKLVKNERGQWCLGNTVLAVELK